jgi:hypothetical protein
MKDSSEQPRFLYENNSLTQITRGHIDLV